MILETDFLTHWKFEALCGAIGDAKAFRALIRLWTHAQVRKQWIFPLDPLKLASICGVREDLEGFWEHMTGRAGWVEARGGGWFELRGWANINRSMIQAWCTKTKRLPWMDEYDAAVAVAGPAGEETPVAVVKPLARGAASRGSLDLAEEVAGGSCDAPRDPSYDAPNRGDGGEGMDGIDGMEKIEGMDRTVPAPGGKEPPAVSQAQCTLEQAIAYGPMCHLSPEAAAFWWHTRNAADWHRGTAGGGPSRKVSSWQSDMASSRHWAEAGAEKHREREGRRRVTVRL
jgi:hypothetical protein